jgi:octaprenyl-diphosphate synthase
MHRGRLTGIAEPIRRDLKDFRKFFRSTLKTDNLLLDTALRYILRKKGKQVRPILTLLSAGLVGSISRRSWIGASMVELLHTATLVHDDVVDEADERRGRPSINAVWNNKTAVLVGDYMLAQGLRIANENREFDFLDITSRTVQRMSEGELMQTRKSRSLDITEEEYFRIIRDKTAALLGACCEIGALSATDDRELAGAMRNYGESLGMAFQIRDDVFDYAASSADVGKPTGNDVQERKMTLPLIHGIREAPRRDAKRIVKSIRDGAELNGAAVEQIRSFVNEHSGIDYAQRRAVECSDVAKAELERFPDSPHRQALIDLAEFVVTRTS